MTRVQPVGERSQDQCLAGAGIAAENGNSLARFDIPEQFIEDGLMLFAPINVLFRPIYLERIAIQFKWIGIYRRGRLLEALVIWPRRYHGGRRARVRRFCGRWLSCYWFRSGYFCRISPENDW